MSQQIAWFNTVYGNPQYVHFKTSAPVSQERIFMIEAEGYNYGTGTPILCAWGIYTTGATAVHKGLTSASGLMPDGVYGSSDGYACIRAYNASSLYYAGWTLTAYGNPYYMPSTLSILAVNQNSNSGNYY